MKTAERSDKFAIRNSQFSMPKKSPAISLEDQLASVMEREGVSMLAADGVRFVSEPTNIEVTRTKTGNGRRRRRPSKAGYADRPAVSVRDDGRLRDAVADLDRVVVGFGQASAPRLRTAPVAIRHAEHERSPFVVSLRGLILRARPRTRTNAFTGPTRSRAGSFRLNAFPTSRP